MVRISTLGDIINASDHDLLEHAKKFGLGHDNIQRDIIYQELNRRYIKRTAGRVIVAAIITGVVTVLIQVFSMFTGK